MRAPGAVWKAWFLLIGDSDRVTAKMVEHAIESFMVQGSFSCVGCASLMMICCVADSLASPRVTEKMKSVTRVAWQAGGKEKNLRFFSFFVCRGGPPPPPAIVPASYRVQRARLFD